VSRITLGELKKAGRDPASRRSVGNGSFPTPMPMAMAAVRRLHRDGAASARQRLVRSIEQSDYWGPRGRPQSRSWAQGMIECFDTYVQMDLRDGRQALQSGLARDVGLGGNVVGVNLDVILLDPAGYVGRHTLWDRAELTSEDATLQAAPIVSALQDSLGADRVVGVQVWHLRSGTEEFVDANSALARMADVSAVVARYLS